MTSATVRLAGREDAAAIAAMIDVLDRYYIGDARAPGLAATLAMVERVFDTAEGTRFALAFVDGRAVGIACFAVLRPGHRLGGVLFLKDLFVRAEARGAGVGVALVRFLAAVARREGIGRIDLTTERDNVDAQRLYERLGAARQDKVFYRFDLAGTGLLD